MLLFKMPKAVTEKLDRIWRDFLWEGHGDKKKLHLMKWSDVIKPKYNGGLGLSGLAGEMEVEVWAGKRGSLAKVDCQ